MILANGENFYGRQLRVGFEVILADGEEGLFGHGSLSNYDNEHNGEGVSVHCWVSLAAQFVEHDRKFGADHAQHEQ